MPPSTNSPSVAAVPSTQSTRVEAHRNQHHRRRHRQVWPVKAKYIETKAGLLRRPHRPGYGQAEVRSEATGIVRSARLSPAPCSSNCQRASRRLQYWEGGLSLGHLPVHVYEAAGLSIVPPIQSIVFPSLLPH